MRTYEIHVRGDIVADEFDELEPLQVVSGQVATVLRGPIEDQAALHGVLRRLQGLGLELVEVRRLPDQPLS